jgi:integrase
MSSGVHPTKHRICGGSNPTPRTTSFTPRSEPRHIQEIDPKTLSAIIELAFWMQRTGYRKSTITTCARTLRGLARQTNLMNPEAVKAYIGSAELSENRKTKLIEDATRFYKYHQIPFIRPRYHRIETIPFIPLELEVDQLISGVGQKSAVFLHLIKETAARPGEAWNCKWADIDSERSCVTIRPEKNSKARQRKLSDRLMSMLNALPHNSVYLFHRPDSDPLESLDDFRRTFIDQRRKVATTMQNPRILNINFKTLRHWKATTEYHRTKDILYVMELLGHKNIRNTLVYTHLVSFEPDEYTCKVAATVEEARTLIEQGFDYVTDLNDIKLFRKRK